MFKRTISCLTISLFFSCIARGATGICNQNDLNTGDVVVQFNSFIPTLKTTTVIQNGDGSQTTSVSEYLSAKAVCGTPVDFTNDCIAVEKQGPMGYDFTFTCTKQNLTGEFYISESQEGTFSCNGKPKAVFENCVH